MASFIVYGDASGQVTVAAPAVAGSNTITFPAETGTLYTTASTTALPGQIAWDTTVKTSGFTAVAYGGYFCNTTSGAFTVTLPATPTRGQFVVIIDYAGTSATNNITVSGNGSNIKGVGSSATLATNRQGITFTYIDSTQGWLGTSNVYGGSTPFTQTYTASYLVVAGGGGAGATGNGYDNGISGSNSVLSGSGITTVTSIGGGYGGTGYTSAARAGGSGGSGGGGQEAAGGSGTPGQGNNGGSAPGGGVGGGGGAGAVGGNAPSGTGGNGLSSSITGSSVTRAGGGGGAGGSGGSGGGGNGGTPASRNAVAGTTNTGSGGGGGWGNVSPGGSGGSGGSGVVILSVPTAKYTGTTTGSPTVTTSGSNTILTYTGSGTYTA